MLGRVLNTVSVSANHPRKSETTVSKDPLWSARNESIKLEIQKQRSIFHCSNRLCCPVQGLDPRMT